MLLQDKSPSALQRRAKQQRQNNLCKHEKSTPRRAFRLFHGKVIDH